MIAAAASLLVSLALGELLLRLTWHNPYKNEQPERIVFLRVHHAGEDHIFLRGFMPRDNRPVRFRTDERGYIFPSRRFTQPDVTVAFLGGSTTECMFVHEGLRFPALVSRLLEIDGFRVNALNAGRSGATTHDMLNILLNHVLQDKPDVVVLMEGHNDAGVLRWDGSYRSREGVPLGPSVSMAQLARATSSVSAIAGLLRYVTTTARVTDQINVAGRRDIEKFDARIPASDPYEKRLRALVRIVRVFGAEPVLMTQPSSALRNELTPAWTDIGTQQRYNDIVRKVAADDRVVVFDLAEHLITSVPRWDDPMKIFYDGVHVTDEGSRVYAEYIAERLRNEVLPRHLRRS